VCTGARPPVRDDATVRPAAYAIGQATSNPLSPYSASETVDGPNGFTVRRRIRL